jgi:pimeloyl-ACP methyl ester carboxylesterase
MEALRGLLIAGLCLFVTTACEDISGIEPDAVDAIDGDDTSDISDTLDGGDSDADATGDYRPEQVSATEFVYAPNATEHFGSVWPSDERTGPENHVDFSGFPERNNIGLIDSYATTIEESISGFSIMPVIYVPLTGEPDESTFPSIEASTAEDSPVRLRRVLPDCGPPVPIETRFQEEGDTYMPDETLLSAPVIGHPLTPGDTYALIYDGDWKGRDGLPMYAPEAFYERLLSAAPSSPDLSDRGLAALRACESEAIENRTLRMATTFTIQNPAKTTREMRDVAVADAETTAPSIRDFRVLNGASGENWTTYRGLYDTPIFMRGESPYDTGGGVEFDSEGTPLIQRVEEVPFTLAVPSDVTGPVPVVLWEDGTGATIRSHLNDDWFFNAIDAGFAVATFAPQFHDARATEDSEEVFSTFNYLNPEAGRTVFRQQAVDTSYFIEVIKRAMPGALETIEEPVALDTDNLLYGGHSQGGLVGVLVSAIEPRLQSFVLSGTGAYTTVTVLERKDLFDIEQLLKGLFQISGDLDRMHPLVQLIQLGADAVDPHSYIDAWNGWDGDPNGVSVFAINGDEDPTTHVDAVDHLTIAGQLTPIPPAGWVPARLPADEIDPGTLPIASTIDARDGSPNTRVTWLEGGGGHFTLYRRLDVPQLAVDFWTSTLQGVPTIPEFTPDP